MIRIIILNMLLLAVSMLYSQKTNTKYVIKHKSIDGKYYLELKPSNLIDSISKEKHGARIDERDLFLNYSNFQKAEILRELLSFQGDTTKSTKSYKLKTPDLRKIQVEPFTIQIEALYTFSRMLLLGYPYFQPKLTNKKNKVNFNKSQRTIDEVYDIYWLWLENAINSDFKDLSLPMTGTKYQWEGQEKITSNWLIKFQSNSY